MRRPGSAALELRNRGYAAFWTVAGLVAAGLAHLAYKTRRGLGEGDSGASPRSDLAENARKALAMREAGMSHPRHPVAMTAGEGMRPITNSDAAPSGALNQEGHRPVLERSRKVR